MMAIKTRKRVHPIFLAVFLVSTLFSWAWAGTRDAIFYALEGGRLVVSGPFSDEIGHVTIRDISTKEYGEGEISAPEASRIVESLFRLSIGDNFLEVFGNHTEIDLKTYGEKSQADALVYDYATLRGACLRRSNRQMALMIDLKQGGTANAGNPPDTLFIFADENKKVRYEIINRDLWTNATCLDEARLAALSAERVYREEAALIDALALSGLEVRLSDDAQPSALAVARLKADPRPRFHHHLAANSEYYFPDSCERNAESFAEECAKTQSSVTRVFESDRYDIHRAQFIRYCASEGFDFLHDKKTDMWTAFFRSATGCSKYYLCVPEYHDIEGDILNANIPLGCIHWGDWRTVQINMETFAVQGK